jgi:O-antigen/teichoic acid export membrane protein
MVKFITELFISPLINKLLRYFSSNIISAGFSFISILFSARFLSTRELGIVAMFQLLVSFTTIFLSVNVDSALSRKFFDKDYSDEELKTYCGSAIQILSFTSFIIIVLLFVASELITELFSLESLFIFCGFFSTLFNIVIEIRLSQWRIRGNVKKFTQFQIGNSLLNLVTTFLLISFFLPNAKGRIFAILISGLVFAFLSILSLTRDKLYVLSKFNLIQIKEILKFGIPLIPHTLGILLLTFFDRFFIKSRLGLENTGIYVLSVQFAAVLGLLFESLNSSIMPLIYEKLNINLEIEKRNIVKLTYRWYFIVCIMAVLLLFVSPFIINGVTSNKFLESTSALKWLIFGQVFSGMYLMKSNYIYYAKKTKWISIITIVSGLLNILLCILLIDEYGISGVAIAFMISMAFRFFMTWNLANRFYPMPWFYNNKNNN